MDESDAAVAGIVTASTSVVIVFQEIVMPQANILATVLLDLLRVWGYAGAFVLGLLGNLLLEVPIPYVLTTFVFGLWGLHPVVLGLFTASGATLGNFIFYSLGRGISIEGARRKFGPRYDDVSNYIAKNGFITTFFYSMSPLPDGLLMVPLGASGYSLPRAFAANFLGKLVYITFFASIGAILGTLVVIPLNGFTLALGFGGGIVGTYLTLKVDWLDVSDRLEQQPLISKTKTVVLTQPYVFVDIVLQFPIPVAVIASLGIITLAILSGFLLLQIISVLGCTGMIIYAVFVELTREY